MTSVINVLIAVYWLMWTALYVLTRLDTAIVCAQIFAATMAIITWIEERGR